MNGCGANMTEFSTHVHPRDGDSREGRTRRSRPHSSSAKQSPSQSANLNRAAIQDHIVTITTALRSLPKDHPSVTAHLLTRSTLYLTLHHASKSSPTQPSSFAQGALRDARQLVHTVPHLPAAWLALFSACLAVARPADADLALRAAARFCPFDPALRYVTRSFRPSNTLASPVVASSGASRSVPGSTCMGSPAGPMSAIKHSTTSGAETVRASCIQPSPKVVVKRSPESDPGFGSKHSEEWVLQTLCDAEDALVHNADDKAIALYDVVLTPGPQASVLPEGVVLRALSGRCDALLKKSLRCKDGAMFSSALADARQIVSLFPSVEDGWLRLGQAHISQNNFDQAEDTFRRALLQCPRSINLSNALSDVRSSINQDKPQVDWGSSSSLPTSQSDTSHDNIENRSADSCCNTRKTLEFEHGQDKPLSLGGAQSARGSEDIDGEEYNSRPPAPRAMLCASGSTLKSSENLSDSQRKEEEWKEAVMRENYRREEMIRREQEVSKRREAERISVLRSEESGLGADTVCHENLLAPSAQIASLDCKPLVPSTQLSVDVVDDQDHTDLLWQNPMPRTPVQVAPEKAFPDSEHSRQSDPSQRSDLSSDPGPNQQKLYELLQVPRNASEAQIKKSYYDLARKYHPDKNADDAKATEQFQRLAEAYRVLSDPESRAVYDRYGDRGLMKNSVDVIDPSTLFAMVFGSDQFVNLIGELQLASLASNVDESGNTPTEDVLTSVQRVRVGKLVLEMVKILKPWVDGDKKGFLREVHQQMKVLREASFGPSLLHTVGNVYVQQTTYLLDKTRPFNLSAVMRKATIRSHKIAAQHKAMNAASRVMEKQRKLHDRVMRTGRDQRYISENEAKAIAVEMAENAIDMMWKISVIDIETTLEDVLMIVLSGRDLVAEGEIFTPIDSSLESLGATDRSRNRRRLGSHLGREWRERSERGDRSDRSDRSERGEHGRDIPPGRAEVGLVRPLHPLSHGDAAVTRHEILSERAYGIQAMGRIFMSAAR